MMLVLAVVTLAVGTATADDCRNYAEYPHWISQLETEVAALDVIVDGNLAYVAVATAGIIVVDVSDPWHPVQIGSLGGPVDSIWPATANRLALGGGYLFVADGPGRQVHVVDVSDPTAPTPVTQVPTVASPDGLALAGDHLYVAVRGLAVEIFAISDPTAPQPVGTLPQNLVNNVRVFGDRLYTTRNPHGGVGIYGLGDPAAPDLLGGFACEQAMDVTVRDDLAYVASLQGSRIVDVSDPRNARIIASLRSSWSIATDGKWAYLTPVGGVVIYDLADPLAPVQATYLPRQRVCLFSFVRQVAVSNGFAFAAADDAGLMVADLADRTSPPLTTTLDLPATAERIRLRGDHALVAAGTAGMLVLDMTDPANPVQVGNLASQDARAVVTAGQMVYLADGGDGLKIVDLGNPAAPRQVGHLDTVSRVAAGLALDGDVVYMATGLNGLMVIDVSDSANPSLLGQTETADRALDVCVDGPYAFVAHGANGSGGLQVLDIADPGAPWVAASLDLCGEQKAMLLDSSILYIGGLTSGVWAVDVSSPTAPVALGWLPVEALDLALDGNILIAAGGDGVTFVDCFDPAALRSVGFLPTWEDCPTVALADSFLLIAGARLHSAPRQCADVSGAGDLPPNLSAWASLSGHPNPFNPRIEVAFELQKSQRVSLEVYDLAGRQVAVLAEGEYAATAHRVYWDGNDSRGSAAAAGCYFVLLRGQRELRSLKVMLVR